MQRQNKILRTMHKLKVCRRKVNGNKFINSTATRIIRHRYGDVSTAQHSPTTATATTLPPPIDSHISIQNDINVVFNAFIHIEINYYVFLMENKTPRDGEVCACA